MYSDQSALNETKVVSVGLVPDAAAGEASRFRDELYACLTRRGDELFERADAVLCAPGAAHSAVELTLLPEHRRGHGAMYDGLSQDRINSDRIRSLPASLPLPRFPDAGAWSWPSTSLRGCGRTRRGLDALQAPPAPGAGAVQPDAEDAVGDRQPGRWLRN